MVMTIIIELAYPYQELKGIMRQDRISFGVGVNVSCGPSPGINGQWLVAFSALAKIPMLMKNLPCCYLGYLLGGTPGGR